MAECPNSPLSEFEEKCCQEVEREGTPESRLLSDAEGRIWVAFQEAARAVTDLCRESASACRATAEAARHCGHQQRNREILEWACTKRHFIRREDLIAMLVGRVAPEQASSLTGCPNSEHCHCLSAPHPGPHVHARSPVSCSSSAVPCPGAVASPLVPTFPSTVHVLSEGTSLSNRRRSGTSDDNQLWDAFRLSSRKRPSSADDLMGSPKRSRFL